jgi:alkanesulfonate monooxygenase SsuD/methylene tetrahydromethanopterin reductase-like flavin-dependent oxidoreductase (luciferase family)
MRFSLFVHMERVSDQQTQKQLYDEMIELCQIADQGGMHAIWTGEHHAMNFTIAPNPFINLVDIANKTKMYVWALVQWLRHFGIQLNWQVKLL